MVSVNMHVVLNFNTNTIVHILHWPIHILLILTQYCKYEKYVHRRKLYDEIGHTYRLVSIDFYCISVWAHSAHRQWWLYEEISHTVWLTCMCYYSIQQQIWLWTNSIYSLCCMGCCLCYIQNQWMKLAYSALICRSSRVW